jgi:hypothetical protein
LSFLKPVSFGLAMVTLLPLTPMEPKLRFSMFRNGS